MKKNKKLKAGKIEFYRFIFSIIIVLFHSVEHFQYHNNILFTNSFRFTFFAHGAIGVEFFFIVSGFLLALSIDKKDKRKKEVDESTIIKETYETLGKKIKSIFPQHIVAFIISFICAVLYRKYNIQEIIRCLVGSIPQFFFLQGFGIKVNDLYTNNPEWYISAMLIGVILLYPVLRKNYEKYSKYYAPIIGLIVLGYLNSTFGKISTTLVWNDFFVSGTLRAIGMMSFGVFSYEVVKFIDTKYKKESLTLFFIENICLILIIMYIISDLSIKYEVIVSLLILMLVTLGFSKKTKFSKLFDNKIVYFLGKISLTIYLTHLPAINLTKAYFSIYPFYQKVILTLIFTALFTIITTILGNKISKLLYKND